MHRLTAGHAGLVCACGRALDTAVQRLNGTITLASWRSYALRDLPAAVRNWQTVGRMAERIAGFTPQQLHVLEVMLAAGESEVTARSTNDISAARFLAAEGWLRSVGAVEAAHVYRIASPLVQSIALKQLAASNTITEPLPIAAGQLLLPDVIATSLRFFKPAVMRSSADVSSKVSAATARARSSRRNVPSEAAYHAQLAFVLCTWLRASVDVFTEADSFVEREAASSSSSSGKTKKLYADVLLIGRSGDAPRKHVLELVASASDADIGGHYDRTLAYMAAQGGAGGACITFTAVQEAADVGAVDPETLFWPTPAQLDAGLVAIHVVHDDGWTAARVHCKKAGQAATSTQIVQLSEA